MSWIGHVVGRLPRSWLKAAARVQWRHPWLKRAFDWAAAWVRRGPAPIAHGAGRGLLFDAGPGNAGYVLGTSEPHVQQALELLVAPGMTVYDVGANVGFFAMIAARLVGPEGRVICFEPVAENAGFIARNAELNGFRHVTVRHEALGRTDGEATFLLSETPGWGKLAGVGDVPPGARGTITVPVRRLDGLLAAERLPPPDLIKVDVEGAETAVLAGATDLLGARHPILVIELHGTNHDVAQALDALRYRTIVVGSNTGVREARWDAHVVAFPPGLDRLVAQVPALTRLTAHA